MKLKIVTCTVAAALYGAGAMQAAASMGQVHQLKGLQLTQEEISSLITSSANTPILDVAQAEGLNMQITPQTNKFVYEEGLTGEQIYIVRLNQKPLAQVSADLLGSTGTSVRSTAKASKLYVAGQPSNSAVQNYRSQLLTSQNKVLAEIKSTVGAREARQQFTNAVNGFSMAMTQEEAQRVSQLANVASVRLSKNYELQSDAGPQLIQADKIWTGAATQDAVPYKGEGIIMGIIDTGINSDHPSFAVMGDDGYKHINPWEPGKFIGDCTKEGFETMCNDKLIGVRSYPVITDNFTNGNYGATRPAVGEDYQGHGSHVASTAAGNVLLNVDYISPDGGKAVSDGTVIKEKLFPSISGVAPHANIIAYQVCHPDNAITAGCPGEALLAGIEDAIKDGVDVINFSIGGQDSNPWADDIELAFLAAREAGISVAVAAGNSGQPTGYKEYFGAIDHASPWLMNVAATTHDREVEITTKLVDPTGGTEAPKWTEIVGGAINKTSVTGRVVLAKTYGDEYCAKPFAEGSFDLKDADGNPTDVIVVCKRDSLSNTAGTARSVKADNVKAGGGDGMIMYNYAIGDAIVPTASYSIPSIHIIKEEYDGRYDNGMAGYGLIDWLNKGGMPTLTITATDIERTLDPARADWLAAFSSRGPSPSTPEALIPAVAAPGVNIYAAFADEHPFSGSPSSGDFSFLSGTSMASPHVAGSMALLRQAQPSWSATEIQSALAMTAENKVHYYRLDDKTSDVALAQTYRAGTGRINVANAVNVGFVMDETVENFKAANPNNGGAVHKLNIPQLVNFECKPKCQWIRTIKATKDGSWSVTNGDVINWNVDTRNQLVQNGVSIKASPSEFTLKAGETMDIVIEASIMDTQDWFSNSEVELHSNLIFTETSANASEAHWPIVFKYDKNSMPSMLNAKAHRNDASVVFKGINLPENDNVYGRMFAPVKAVVKTIELPKDDDDEYAWSKTPDLTLGDDMRIDEATYVEWIDVPAGSRRLIVESLGNIESTLKGTSYVGNLNIYVGKDYNGNGKPDPLEEVICVSNHGTYNNFCNINQPEEGTYWAVFYSSQKGTAADNFNAGVVETYKLTTAVVTDEVASNLNVDVPASNGTDPVDVTMNWNIPEMTNGDIYYSLMDFGSSAVNAGNIGKVAVKLERGIDDVNLDVTQTKALPGDQIPLTFQVQPNDSGADRAFSIVATIPEGLKLKAEDVLTSSSAIVKDVKLEDNKLTISGVQPDTRDLAPSYNVTTNAEDPMCRTPNFGNSNPGGYVNLEEFGIYPSMSGFAPIELGSNGRVLSGKDNNILYTSGIGVPVKTLFGGDYDRFHLYNNGDVVNGWIQNNLEIRGTGVLSLYQGPKFLKPDHLQFPFKSVPYSAIGMLWRGVGTGAAKNTLMSVPLINTSSERAGITLASTSTGWGILEYDNARSYTAAGTDSTTRAYKWTEADDRFDFELLFNVNTRYGDGEYEMMMAYDNIDFGTQDGRGSVGLQGFKGLLNTYGPLEGYLGEQFAYDNLDEKLTSGLVICYDYVGPEVSQFEVTAWTTVKDNTAGKVLTVDAVSQVDGMADINMSHSISVPGNISVARIANQTTPENTSLAGLKVIYADEQNSVNTISVTGDNITAVVDGHTSGSSVTITPKKNFHGDVQVTVTVTDVENPADKASTTFMLTVVSDGKGATTETPTETPVEETESSSGGALGGLSMLLALGAMIRRRTR
ncbi:peptidase S8 and S53, subtilisin, kexin, sedolisin [Shewanella sp. ANA-3]|uniref:S8 family serine peptidase n=1 Tax=Shewanella sp. (strain ANA-3) TaxID=94122 RepID=UPI00005DFD45|nr:S8 family serine peptidase [Shewanella sp. ANA-3]ABK49528.1 peptidase S8 and S53, subtilisin, kexin, sedolisin [Shewanella sp. ANA-3]